LSSENGQSAVEFAMVVPLLCLVIIAILHFGKVMNYWLDLNHVASEGARKAAVNTYDSDGEYDTYIRSRLETGELRTGGTTSIPSAATIAVCLPEGSDVGDPVTVQVAVGYSLPFIGSTVSLRGTATMRLEQPADYAGGGACA
jgi:Flp pilus assembly protein TadG